VIPSALLDNLTARGPSFGAVASGLNKPGHYRKSGGWHQRANRQPVFSGRPHAEATFRLPVESWTRIETAVADLGPIEHMLGGLVRHGDARIHCVILQHTLKVKGDNNTSLGFTNHLIERGEDLRRGQKSCSSGNTVPRRQCFSVEQVCAKDACEID